MAIVHILPKLVVGGAEIGAINLLENSKDRDYFLMFIYGGNENILSRLSEENKSRVILCNGLYDAIKKLRILNPRIIITSLWKSHILGVIGQLLFKFNRIHFAHSASYRSVIDRIITNISLKISNYYFSDSKKTELFLKLSDNSYVVPMCITFSKDRSYFDFGNELTFVFFGRINSIKNLSYSLEFINGIRKNGYNVTFDIYGPDDGDKINIIEKIEKLDLSDCIKIKDEVAYYEVENIMRHYNYYLQSSESEGMAISVYQSLYNGLLPVVTAVGEISNYTEHGKNAFHLKGNINEDINSFIVDYNSRFDNYEPSFLFNNYQRFDEVFFLFIDKVCKGN